MYDPMSNEADIRHGECGNDRAKRMGEIAFGQMAFDFASRSRLYEPGAADADSFHAAADMERFVPGVVKTVFER